MKAIKTTFFAVIAVALVASCTKYETFVNTLFDCECGTLSLDGRNLNVRLAEGYFHNGAYNDAGQIAHDYWRYHVVVDFRTEDEIANHVPSHDVACTIAIPLTSGTSDTGQALAVLTANEIEVDGMDVFWDITGGEITVNRTDTLHTLIFSNVVTNKGTINAELTIVPE
tara:strand:+ start:841 stop:1347 length:507 start_codon:yes stop_codon:yes gene_type:complete